jgi:2-(1,2-epoxy-1,2-dihydrophenyl)acetyl-CoA isomerase
LIAAVNGPAVGVGLSLVLACDLRVASEAARFGVGFLNVGLTPDAGATYLLPMAVGYSTALELAATGELIDAWRGLELGLVNRVVPVDSLQQEVDELAARLSEVPPAAFAATKKLFREAPAMGLRGALREEARAQPDLLSTRVYRERIESFLARRTVRTGGKEDQ